MMSNIPWRNHLIELIVVFIGITTAFMLNNWREDQRSRAEEAQYMTSFREEIGADLDRLDTTIARNDQTLLLIGSAINTMQTGTLPRDTMIAVISRMAQIRLFIPKTNVYESIKYSGNFNLIENTDLRTDLIGYYESFEGKKLVEEYYKLYINTYIIPFLFDHIDMVNAEIVPSERSSEYRMRNMVIGYFQLLTQVVDKYRQIAADGKALLQEIRDRYPQDAPQD